MCQANLQSIQICQNTLWTQTRGLNNDLQRSDCTAFTLRCTSLDRSSQVRLQQAQVREGAKAHESTDRQGISHYVQRSFMHSGRDHTDHHQSRRGSKELRRLERTQIEHTEDRPRSQTQPMAAPC